MAYESSDGADKKKKVAIIGVSSLILVAMVVAVAVGVKSNNSSDSSNSGNAAPASELSTSSKAVKALCAPTDYKETCVKSLEPAAGNTTDTKELIKIAFDVTMKTIKEAIANSTTLKDLAKDPRGKVALDDCQELMEHAIDDLKESFEKLGTFEMGKLQTFVEDLKTWISGSLTYQQTCIDGFHNTTGEAGQKMKEFLKISWELTSNGLAMVDEFSKVIGSFNFQGTSRRLMESDEAPSWVDAGKRKLLAATPATIKPDVVVAKDGTGKYTTINEALKDVPVNSAKQFVIYIKAGIYKEKVDVPKNLTNVVMMGDGPTKTRITGDISYVMGVTTTWQTATFSAIGVGFMAKDIGFENTAGPEGHQAVALRVGSDKSVFYNCHMDGYQDTLYTHAHRQFFRDCTVSGTIDFVFGNALAIFQNCKMVVRKPMDNQQCIVTAQGRIKEREPTAIVFQNCSITAEPALLAVKDISKSYLARPWKDYSRFILMQSQIDGFIQPEGFLPWMGTFAINTCWYAEFGNRGPGAVTTHRVTWPGIKKLTAESAVDFTPAKFFEGDSWIPATGVPYEPGMMNL